jgi:hypothetical protein
MVMGKRLVRSQLIPVNTAVNEKEQLESGLEEEEEKKQNKTKLKKTQKVKKRKNKTKTKKTKKTPES